MQKLTQEAVTQALAELPGWQLEGSEITRTWTFPDFIEAMAFVNKVASIAEETGHHPDIDIRYNRVRLALTTHDASGLTLADTKMAHRIDLEL